VTLADRPYNTGGPSEKLDMNLASTHANADYPSTSQGPSVKARRTAREVGTDCPKMAPEPTRNTPLQHNPSGPSDTSVRTVRPDGLSENQLQTNAKPPTDRTRTSVKDERTIRPSWTRSRQARTRGVNTSYLSMDLPND
jgi:hypothetical protein